MAGPGGRDVIAAACVRLAAAVHTHLLEGVWIAEPFMKLHYDPTKPARVESARTPVPAGPGLGLVPHDGAVGDPAASFT